MEPDNIYPNDTTYFGVPVEPPEQVIARKKERAQTLEAANVIETLWKHFEERIAYRDSLSSIKPDLAKDPVLHQKACEVNTMLKLALVEEKEMLEELLEIHYPNR